MQKSNPKKVIFKKQTQRHPGMEYKMDPLPEFDDDQPEGTKLEGKKCIITGGDSGIGRAVAVAFAKQGADVAIMYLKSEQQDANFTANYIKEKFKRTCLTVPADISKEANCKKAIQRIMKKFER